MSLWSLVPVRLAVALITDGSRHSTLFRLLREALSYRSFSPLIQDRYQDSEFDSWGALRVLNEDRVEPGTGFGTHGHREFEIFSYIVSGELEQYVPVQRCLSLLILCIARTPWVTPRS